MAGFSHGEGSFIIGIQKSNRYYTGFQVHLAFMLTQHIWDEELIINLIKYFGFGNITKYRKAINFGVTKLSFIENKIIPFFSKYPIYG